MYSHGNLSSSEDDDLFDDSDPKKKFHPRRIYKERLKQQGLDATYAKHVEKPKEYEEDKITYSNLEILLIVFLTLLMAFVIYEYELVHILALRFFANMGDKDAQHILGQRYFLGKGVERSKPLAFYWFKEAAKQGHGQASYNLGVAHIQGFHRLERKGEAHDLIKHAAKVGVKEAEEVLRTACAKGECDR